MVRAAIFDLSVTLLDTLEDLSNKSNAAVHYTRSAAANSSVQARDAAVVLCIALGALRGVDPLVRLRDAAFGMNIVFGAMIGDARYGARGDI